ncbi:MAG: ABC transporter ATP-binding protein [Oscillospiraceae bacterium]|nr:ABC transporter ATP-binding protein [Oscillospiraceae bacterium]
MIGHNGAGKTTLLNQICGNVKPDSGNITYNDISLVKNSKYARDIVATMPQFHAPLAGVTLRQAINSILYIKVVSGDEAKKQLDNILKELDIHQWKKISGDKLSGGLQRLTSFAMTVVAPSPIILLDEPTNDVDPVRRKLIWKYIQKLANSNHVVIVITHNLLEVEQYADRYILLHKGEMVADTVINEIKLEDSIMKLCIDTSDNLDIASYPEAIDVQFNKEMHQIIFKLSYYQVMKAIEWLFSYIALGHVIRYSLVRENLDSMYRGLVNE